MFFHSDSHYRPKTLKNSLLWLLSQSEGRRPRTPRAMRTVCAFPWSTWELMKQTTMSKAFDFFSERTSAGHTFADERSVKGNGTKMMSPRLHITLYQIITRVKIGLLFQERKTPRSSIDCCHGEIPTYPRQRNEKRICPPVFSQSKNGFLVTDKIDEFTQSLAAFRNGNNAHIIMIFQSTDSNKCTFCTTLSLTPFNL